MIRVEKSYTSSSEMPFEPTHLATVDEKFYGSSITILARIDVGIVHEIAFDTPDCDQLAKSAKSLVGLVRKKSVVEVRQMIELFVYGKSHRSTTDYILSQLLSIPPKSSIRMIPWKCLEKLIRLYELE